MTPRKLPAIKADTNFSFSLFCYFALLLILRSSKSNQPWFRFMKERVLMLHAKVQLLWVVLERLAIDNPHIFMKNRWNFWNLLWQLICQRVKVMRGDRAEAVICWNSFLFSLNKQILYFWRNCQVWFWICELILDWPNHTEIISKSPLFSLFFI